MRFLVEETEHEQKAYETLIVNNSKVLSILSNELALRIIQELGKKPSCPMDVARKLKEHEQKIYYHTRKLEKLGLIKVERLEKRVGALAKIYSPVSPVVSFKLFEGDHIDNSKTRISELKFLRPFVRDGELNSIIIVGSPDPHGKYKCASSDGCCAIDLAMFLGQFVNESTFPYYKLDTEVRDEDLKKNLILIGGPKSNIITERISKKLPIYFDYSDELREWNIVSSLSKTIYRDQHEGFVIKTQSLFNDEKEILVFAGKGFKGTKAAIIAFIKHPREVMKGNSVAPNVIARVVRGIDVDSDGIVDDVEFLE